MFISKNSTEVTPYIVVYFKIFYLIIYCKYDFFIVWIFLMYLYILKRCHLVTVLLFNTIVRKNWVGDNILLITGLTRNLMGNIQTGQTVIYEREYYIFTVSSQPRAWTWGLVKCLTFCHLCDKLHQVR